MRGSEGGTGICARWHSYLAFQVSSLDLLVGHHPGRLFGDGSPDDLPTRMRTRVVGTYPCLGACHDGVSFLFWEEVLHVQMLLGTGLGSKIALCLSGQTDCELGHSPLI